MTTVDETPAVEARPTRQDAMRVAIELDKLNPPPASIWFHGGAQIHVFISNMRNPGDVRAHFDGWLDILGIEEFTETDETELHLTAEGSYQDIQVKVKATIYNHCAAAQTKTRTVTR